MNTAAAADTERITATAPTRSLASTIALHLIPGAIFAASYVALASPLHDAGVPPIATFALTATVVLIPLELGYLLLQGRRRNGRLSLAGVVTNRRPMPARSYAVWLPTLFLGTFALYTVVQMFTSTSMREALFSWVPVWQSDPFGLGDAARYGSTTLVITWLAATVVNGIAGPLVEELYFRGHLLPRLAALGRWAPVVNSVLFALYHFVSPWHLFARALGLMPLFYFVWRRSNIYVGMAVHCALNLTTSLVALPGLLSIL